MKRVVIVLTTIWLSLLVLSCPFLPLGGLNNPADPSSSSYQGYHLTDDPNQIVLSIPDNTIIAEPILIFSEVIGAQGYKIEVALNDEFTDSKEIYFDSNVVEINLEEITQHARYWRAKAKVDDEWGEWSSTGIFIYLHPHTIYFDAQGGTIPNLEYKTIEKGEHYGEFPTTTQEGKVFDGWWSKAGGKGEKIYPEKIVSMDEGHIAYAKWLNIYTVTYDGNGHTGGTVPASQQKVHGASLVIHGNPGAIKREGYYFYGWNTKPDGSGTNYFEDNVYSQDKSITLYANWKSSSIGAMGPAGGYIFYDKGFYGDNWRYLEAAPAGWSGSTKDPSYKFGNYWEEVGTSEMIGSGKSNTQKIVTKLGGGNYAAIAADNYVVTIDGKQYDDWFLPSILNFVVFVHTSHSNLLS